MNTESTLMSLHNLDSYSHYKTVNEILKIRRREAYHPTKPRVTVKGRRYNFH